MFGAQEKNVEGNLWLRGNINVLLLGEPGTAKSQFLKYVNKTGQRAFYTTGKGSSTAGLSAATCKDPITGAWTLQCGALVLANKGICLIDEFDNMNDRDRASIHEAMQQQSISISKAGIVTKEVTCMQDITDPVTDEMLALYIVDNNYKSQPTGAKLDEFISNYQDEVSASAHPEFPLNLIELLLLNSIIPQDLLKKYITYSKLNVFPKLLEAHQEKLMNLNSLYCQILLVQPYKGNSIVTRHFESMIRMLEAHARMHIRVHVSEEDVDVAIRVLVELYLNTEACYPDSSMDGCRI
ncbi:DNA replication licensing factor MCM2 [Cinnamomum micranthum f. kanehirae]|uniref:DNA helicase n=1 Tax=Cinnamomum micranthum f. kanehirae TaxID=337451 RepID=A0A3S3P7S2_9MAGN|nr:DNA replication licensing factor MCM2 [Cinnamomum micranthum f. kanehirae]